MAPRQRILLTWKIERYKYTPHEEEQGLTNFLLGDADVVKMSCQFDVHGKQKNG